MAHLNPDRRSTPQPHNAASREEADAVEQADSDDELPALDLLEAQIQARVQAQKLGAEVASSNGNEHNGDEDADQLAATLNRATLFGRLVSAMNPFSPKRRETIADTSNISKKRDAASMSQPGPQVEAHVDNLPVTRKKLQRPSFISDNISTIASANTESSPDVPLLTDPSPPPKKKETPKRGRPAKGNSTTTAKRVKQPITAQVNHVEDSIGTGQRRTTRYGYRVNEKAEEPAKAAKSKLRRVKRAGDDKSVKKAKQKATRSSLRLIERICDDVGGSEQAEPFENVDKVENAELLENVGGVQDFEDVQGVGDIGVVSGVGLEVDYVENISPEDPIQISEAVQQAVTGDEQSSAGQPLPTSAQNSEKTRPPELQPIDDPAEHPDNELSPPRQDESMKQHLDRMLKLMDDVGTRQAKDGIRNIKVVDTAKTDPEHSTNITKALLAVVKELTAELISWREVAANDAVEAAVEESHLNKVKSGLLDFESQVSDVLEHLLSSSGSNGQKMILKDLYLWVFPHTVRAINTAWYFHEEDCGKAEPFLKHIATLSQQLLLLVKAARRVPQKEQPRGVQKGVSYQLVKPTRDMLHNLKAFVKSIDTELERRRQDRLSEIAPQRREEFLRNEDLEADQVEAARQEAIRQNIEKQNATLAEAALRFEQLYTIQTIRLPPVNGHRPRSGKIPRNSVSNDDVFRALPGEDGRISLGTHNTNDAARKREWSDFEWEVLIDGLERDESPQRYDILADTLTRSMDEILSAAREFKINMETQFSKEMSRVRREGGQIPILASWVACIGKERE